MATRGKKEKEYPPMPANWMYKRGDVYMMDLNPYSGSEQGGVRPAIVVQNDDGNFYANVLLVVPLTTQIKKRNMPTHFIYATLPKYTAKKRDIWTAETLFHALEVCDDPRLRLCINLSFSCSLRLGELLGLTWDCVDISPESIEAGRASIYIEIVIYLEANFLSGFDFKFFQNRIWEFYSSIFTDYNIKFLFHRTLLKSRKVPCIQCLYSRKNTISPFLLQGNAHFHSHCYIDQSFLAESSGLFLLKTFVHHTSYGCMDWFTNAKQANIRRETYTFQLMKGGHFTMNLPLFISSANFLLMKSLLLVLFRGLCSLLGLTAQQKIN